ncbi:MAG TPA: GNAT family N-acetyltransferase [Smithellaceae bacterium]|jgi:acyl-CoA hydrolase/ribosomal protein S18 acetylase RimI-like enzyme|nr:GNAT family N-acetyltransferase [Smithellaceae bacterium]HOE23646.1 GNAT family N-acetyltransferase [Smithellaceae bacterium]HOR63037.1 GNAT family N-acetyltransferase [Smithellaceae bacterium]HPL32518.1 GNAT family N-acetyltransferase [Smithellaceae bacterium]HQH00884.1 GNAT family N-acetyltransferase [Smithellaceae bacterium]
MWKQKIVAPADVLEKIDPGMSIFLGTGMAEPRTLVRNLMESKQYNLQDLELIQLVSLGDAVAIDERYSRKFRLKTFYSGWLASDAISQGRVDLIPSRFSRVAWLFKTGAIHIDVAFIQVTPPDENGYAYLVGASVERQAMEMAQIVVGEINSQIPRTMGDTLVNMADFHYLVEATEPPYYLARWPLQDVYLKIATNIASMIPDGSCISYGIGPLYEALAKSLTAKKNLGVHSPFFTDALMDLVKSGAVTNRYKNIFRGKSCASYVLGTRELMSWLDLNPLVEFQPQDIVMDPRTIGLNDNMIAIFPARKVDLTGGVALHTGKGNVTAGPGNVAELFVGAALSRNGRSIFALPSRNRKGKPNILLSLDQYPFQFTNRESMDIVVTEYGVALLMGKTLRERAQALIEIAHPDDRAELVRQAKEEKMIYADQIYFPESGYLYPEKVACSHRFRDSLTVRFRAIKPSDEEEMRRLFYRFSDQAVYYRYFSPIKTMPHRKMQEYVNVDYRNTMSIVAIVDESGVEKIIGEARYVKTQGEPFADTAFIVDEQYQGMGISTYLFNLLIRAAREEGIAGFKADVLENNRAMLKVYEKALYPVQTVLSGGVYKITIPFNE